MNDNTTSHTHNGPAGRLKGQEPLLSESMADLPTVNVKPALAVATLTLAWLGVLAAMTIMALSRFPDT